MHRFQEQISATCPCLPDLDAFKSGWGAMGYGNFANSHTQITDRMKEPAARR